MEQSMNKMGIVSFAALHFLCGIPLYFIFMTHLFGRLTLPCYDVPLPVETSKLILLTIILICLTLGFIWTMDRNRNIWSVFLNVLTPFGIYLALGMASRASVLLRALIALWGIATVGYGIVLFTAPIRRKRSRARVLTRRAGQLVTGARLLALVMLCLLTTGSIAGVIFGFSAVEPKISYTWTAQIPGDVSRWSDQLQGLKAEQWNKLDLQQKVELMQLVAGIETYYLGFAEEPKVTARNMPLYTLGGYTDVNNTLYISRDHLDYDPPEECLSTVLHEVYHSYQYRLCDLYKSVDISYRSMISLRDARHYIYEFQNYEDGLLDYDSYYNQDCETDAREYAALRCAVYQAELDKNR